MAWTDTLRRVTLPDGRKLIGASFRGVPFFVEDVGRTGGRRAILHEFPLRDEPEIGDNGRQSATFPVTGYVIGDDYVDQRDALIEALEGSSGTGDLALPSYVSTLAICSAMSIRETVTDGRMAVFSLEFIKAPGFSPDSVEAPDLQAHVDEQATAAIAATSADLGTEYDVSGQTAFAVESMETDLVAVATQFGASLEDVVTDIQERARVTADVALLVLQASSLVRQTDQVLVALTDMIDGLSETILSVPGAVADALMEAYATPPVTLAQGDTATRILERANHAAMAAALRRVMVIEAARLLPFVEFATFGEAIASRDSVVDGLDEQAHTAGDAAYPAIINLRAAVLRAVPGDVEYARLVTVERPVAIPSLLLSYQLYGSVEQEADIIERNDPQHPGFMRGTFEVLSDGE